MMLVLRHLFPILLKYELMNGIASVKTTKILKMHRSRLESVSGSVEIDNSCFL